MQNLPFHPSHSHPPIVPERDEKRMGSVIPRDKKRRIPLEEWQKAKTELHPPLRGLPFIPYYKTGAAYSMVHAP